MHWLKPPSPLHQILKSPPCSQTFRKPCYLGTYHFPCFLGTCVNLFRLNLPDKALFDPLKVLEHLQYFKHFLFGLLFAFFKKCFIKIIRMTVKTNVCSVIFVSSIISLFIVLWAPHCFSKLIFFLIFVVLILVAFASNSYASCNVIVNCI